MYRCKAQKTCTKVSKMLFYPPLHHVSSKTSGWTVQHPIIWLMWPGSPAMHLGHICGYTPAWAVYTIFWAWWFRRELQFWRPCCWFSRVSIGLSTTAPYSTWPQLPKPLHTLLAWWKCPRSSRSSCRLLFGTEII